MFDHVRRRTLFLLLALALVSPAGAAELSAEIRDGLASSPFVYISSTRKDGTLSRPAEIWFLWHKGSVYVASSPDSWRIRRIRWGRPAAKIWVGKRDGPSFMATGALVDEAEVHPILFETFARKYGSRWKSWEESFQKGLKDGSRLLVRYTPS